MAECSECYKTLFDFKKKLECDHVIRKNVYYDPKTHRNSGVQCFMCDKCLKVFKPEELKKFGTNVFTLIS